MSRTRYLWHAAILLSMAANVFLFVCVNRLGVELGRLRASTELQASKLSEEIADGNQESIQRLDAVADAMRGANKASAATVERIKSEARRNAGKLVARLEEQQNEHQRVVGELDTLKQAANTQSSKLTEVSGDMSNVKSELDKTGSDLKRVIGDMGVMSGLVATNSKQLAALKELGERNYYEFSLKRSKTPTRVADIGLVLKKADAKRNRYSLEVLSDDRRAEKRDRTVNEPVQLYVSGGRQPYEVVVNQVKKDEIVGYLSTPKVRMARR